MLKLVDEYAGRIDPATAGFPNGRIKNETTPGVSDDGTPNDKNIPLNIWGFMEALLAYAGITADGNIEQVGASQCLTAVQQIALSQGNLMPVSSGATTQIYGFEQCDTLVVDFGSPLVNGRVYRFLPHATNHSSNPTTLNGKPLVEYAYDVIGVTGSVINARYKAIRPGRLTSVMYRSSDDVFIVMNPQESEIIHGQFTTAASGTVTHGWAFTRTGTGEYQIDTGIARSGLVFVNSATAGVLVSATTMAETFIIRVRDSAGNLVNTTASIQFMLVL